MFLDAKLGPILRFHVLWPLLANMSCFMSYFMFYGHLFGPKSCFMSCFVLSCTAHTSHVSCFMSSTCFMYYKCFMVIYS